MSEQNFCPPIADIDAGGDYGLTRAEIARVQHELADVRDLSAEAADAACREAIGARHDRAEYERD